MGRTQLQSKPLDTIWEINDELWQRIEPILWKDAPPKPRSHGGRPRIDWRSWVYASAASASATSSSMIAAAGWILSIASTEVPAHIGAYSGSPSKSGVSIPLA